MKFAFILYRYFPFGGLERNFLNIVNACLNKGHQVDIYTHSWQGDIPPHLSIIQIPSHGLSNHTRLANFAKHAHETWQKHSYDRVIGFQRMPHLDFYYCADVCFRHQSACKHEAWYRWTQRYKTLARFENCVFEPNSSTKILLLSELQKRFYQHYYHTPDERFYLLPPGINPDLGKPIIEEPNRAQFRQKNHCHEEDTILLFIGSDYKRKGLDRILKSLAQLAPEHSIKLWVAGQDNDQPYQRYIKKHHLTHHIHFLGPIKNIKPYLKHADALIHPAYFENTGNVLLEAMITGLPVITTDNCGYAFHIEQANAGIVLDSPFKQTDLTQALTRLIQTDLRQRWRDNAISYSEQQDFHSRAERAVEIIENN